MASDTPAPKRPRTPRAARPISQPHSRQARLDQLASLARRLRKAYNHFQADVRHARDARARKQLEVISQAYRRLYTQLSTEQLSPAQRTQLTRIQASLTEINHG